MILAAALLVLVALGLFVAGLLTGVTVWYWACVAVSALAAVLLLAARRQLARAEDEAPAPPRTREAPAAPPRAEQPEEAGEPEAAQEETEEKTEEQAEQPEQAENSERTELPARTEPEPSRAEREPEPAGDGPGDPAAEDVEVGDLLLVVDMHDDVFVVDEHPRYHLADCRWLADREAIPLPVDEARTDGFTPCGICSPDRHLAQVARARKSAERP